MIASGGPVTSWTAKCSLPQRSCLFVSKVAHGRRPGGAARRHCAPARASLAGHAANSAYQPADQLRPASSSDFATTSSPGVQFASVQQDAGGPLQRLLLAVLWPDALMQEGHTKLKEVSAYMSMARPINLLPSFLLVFLGAWAGTGRTMLALKLGSVWLTSLLSSGVAVASVVVNDYFDYASGVDGVNSPDKPLPSGVIPPDGALLFASVIYIAVLMAACIMEPPLLRLIVALSAGATLLYTPLLKRLTAVKNATVAAIIAASPIAGALAAGATSLGVRAVVAPCAFVFLSIMYREILMDIQDTDGDRAARVWTLPVMLGKRRAMAVATGLFTTASVLALAVAALGSGLSWAWTQYPIPEQLVRAVSLAAVAYVVRPVLSNAWTIWRNSFPREVVGRAIDDTLKPIGLGMLLLAVMA